VTELGICTIDKFTLPLNALIPIYVKFEDKFKLDKLHRQKATSPILVTELGIVTVVKELQFSKGALLL
jgi:hypothetical protein